MNKKIIIVQGGQWGSEAKGAVSLALCQREGIKWAVRTGSINAGHTVIVDGQRHALQQVPVGAFLPDTNVVIGPGAYVHRQTLRDEVTATSCANRLFIDHNCGVHLDSYAQEAKEAGRNLKIGATGKGCAEAIIHKIKDRGVGVPLLYLNYRDSTDPGTMTDTVTMLMDGYHRGETILLEGTQGSLLDVHCGPYPYVTSRQTTAAAWVAEAGLSPSLNYEIALVVRTFPIRVAGNSGPMSRETTWPTLARKINSRLRNFGLPDMVAEEALCDFESTLLHVSSNMRSLGATESEISLQAATLALESLTDEVKNELRKLFEFTTVTKRLRRVACLDLKMLQRTVRAEAPAYIALTFLNYEFPELAHTRKLHREALDYIDRVENVSGCPVRFVSIGPRSEDLLELK